MKNMESRQEQLLILVVEQHIKTTDPVGSKFLVSAGNLSWSEATVRNELRVLEEEGYLSHPHTSAGRIPTEKGYRFFIDNINFDKAKISKKAENTFEEIFKNKEESLNKEVARVLSEITSETVILSFSPDEVYYTGLSNLFTKPEISEISTVADLSAMFDRCEEYLEDFFDIVDDEPKYFIGSEHPFGFLLSAGAFRFGKEGVLVLLGPQRMDYKKNYCLLKKIVTLLNS